MKINIAGLIRPGIVNLKPYVVNNIPHKIKMDANENPYDIPKHIKEHINKEIIEHNFNRYPDPIATELREALASELEVDANQILIGNGSDELISYIISAFGGNGSAVIFPTPTFSIYEISAKLWETKTIKIPLSEGFDLKPDKFIASMNSISRSIVFISFPNNPTGNCFSEQAIAEIVENGKSSIIVLDEAYYEFSRKTFLQLLHLHNNIIILRTFSKAYGLAGLRVGYMVANKEIIDEIMKVKMVYNINSLSQKIALILLKYKNEMSKYINIILQERDKLIDELNKKDGLKVFNTDANFILFRVKTDAQFLFSALLENGILIRNLDEPGLLENCLRVTVGKPDENIAFLSAIDKIL
ncbi:MAG: histidinol-phosphate transaminase [bacterium]